MQFTFVTWCAAVLLCFALTAASRRIISLDGDWELTIPGKKKRYVVAVPRPWQVHSDELRQHAGTAVYRKTVTIPKSWSNKRVFLCFGAVDYYAEVLVDGKNVGEHEGGYTPFEFEITRQVQFGGLNEIEVRVTDPGHGKPVGNLRFEEIPHGKQSWYGNASGIWQSVRLEARNKSYIKNVRIDTDIDHSEVTVAVFTIDAHGGELLMRICPSGSNSSELAAWSTELRSKKAESIEPVRWTARIPSPQLWSPDTPHLYELRAELLENGEVLDELVCTFGMRKIEARDGKILLNNEPIFVAAALDQDFYPGTHYSVPSRAYVEEQFKKAKRMGLNMLRCHIKVPDPVYLECADRLGLLVWYELPNWIDLTDDAKRRAKDTLTAMLERDHNHPSLVIVSIINEGWGIDLLDSSENRLWLAEMYDYAKSLEPDRLIVDNSPCGRNFHVKSDIDDFHIYVQIPDLAPNFAEWIRNFASRPAFTFNQGPEGIRRGDEPLMLSEFGNWGLPRLGPLTDCEGGKPWWWTTGRRANTFPVGAEERFREYGLTSVFGSFDGLGEEFQWQEWRALKFQVEELRKYPTIVGYVVTEFTDLHWEPNGLLDFCRNPKVFSHLMPIIQAQDIVFVRSEKTNFTSGENTSFEFWVSHFSNRDLSDTTLRWQIAEIQLKGETACKIGRAPFAECVDQARITMPIVNRPKKMRMELELWDAQGNHIATNYADFTVYPASAPVVPERTLVLDRLDRAALKEIYNGTNAVICLERPEDMQGRSLPVRIVDRVEDGCWCNCVTWFKQSPAFSGTPVPRVMDFSFEKMIPSSAIKCIDPKFWERDVLSGIFVGWVDSNVAVMVQFRYGNGKAVLTTLPLKKAADSDPLAKWLLASLAKYVQSSACNPGLVLA